jgi:hypothetical protein
VVVDLSSGKRISPAYWVLEPDKEVIKRLAFLLAQSTLAALKE